MEGQRPPSEPDREFAKRLWDDATRMARANAEIARSVDVAPRIVFLLWRNEVLLGICGTERRAKYERQLYEDLSGRTGEIMVEKRVMHS